jgi:hypothetical protein
MLRARRLTDAAGAAVWRVLAADEMFASLGEVLVWLIALEDLVVSVDGQYRMKRNADVDGAVLPGIRYARNAVVHGQTVATTVYSSGGAVLGAAVLGTFALGEGPSIRWSNRSSIGFTPTPSKDVTTAGAVLRQPDCGADRVAAARTRTDLSPLRGRMYASELRARSAASQPPIVAVGGRRAPYTGAADLKTQSRPTSKPAPEQALSQARPGRFERPTSRSGGATLPRRIWPVFPGNKRNTGSRLIFGNRLVSAHFGGV